MLAMLTCQTCLLSFPGMSVMLTCRALFNAATRCLCNGCVGCATVIATGHEYEQTRVHVVVAIDCALHT